MFFECELPIIASACYPFPRRGREGKSFMPAAIPIRCTAVQIRSLRKLQATTRSRRAWSRITALLLLVQGRRCQDVAKALGVCPETITHWKRRWIQGGAFRLKDRVHSGRPPVVTPKYLHLLEEAVDRDPPAYGYLFTVWSAARLAAHLERKTGIRIGPKQLRKYLKKLGFVHRRPKHTLKSRQDPHEVRLAKKRLDALKKGLCGREPATSSGSRTRRISTFTRI